MVLHYMNLLTKSLFKKKISKYKLKNDDKLNEMIKKSESEVSVLLFTEN